MLRYLRICFDKPGTGDLRNEIRHAHRTYLQPFLADGMAVRIVQAGPMCISDTDDTNLGSFIIVEASSIDDVRTFHDNDPFSQAGVYGEVHLVRWDRHINNVKPGDDAA